PDDPCSRADDAAYRVPAARLGYRCADTCVPLHNRLLRLCLLEPWLSRLPRGERARDVPRLGSGAHLRAWAVSEHSPLTRLASGRVAFRARRTDRTRRIAGGDVSRREQPGRAVVPLPEREHRVRDRICRRPRDVRLLPDVHAATDGDAR